MAVYEVQITKAAGGFGQFDASKERPGEESLFADLSDLLSQTCEAGTVVELKDGATLPEGVEDIRGRVHNEPARVFALVSGGVTYFGVNETADIVVETAATDAADHAAEVK